MFASFHDLAEVELNEAAQYYEAKGTGLGAAFLTEAERCLAVILEHPESSPVVLGPVRRRLLRGFRTDYCTESTANVFESWL